MLIWSIFLLVVLGYMKCEEEEEEEQAAFF
jgi:hypothetical protein